MSKPNETKVSGIQVRKGLLSHEASSKKAEVVWQEPVKRRFGESFFKNIAVASALVLCAVTLRTGAIPPLSQAADAVLTAATDQSLLDDQLGKLSFVSALFPEATLVFGETHVDTLAVPVSGGVVVHAWSETEPYISWRASGSQVNAVSGGEVIGVYHGNGDERLVQVLNDDGVACLYGNLAEVYVQTGDAVVAGEPLGTLLSGTDCVFELRQNGRSVNPTNYFAR